MKKIIGVALLFVVATAPALAGGNSGGSNSGGSSNAGGFRMSGGTTHISGGFGSQAPVHVAPAPPTRFAPPTRVAPPTREAPIQSSLDPQRKRTPVEWSPSERPVSYNQPSCVHPYQRAISGINGCAANPGVLYALPDAFQDTDF